MNHYFDEDEEQRFYGTLAPAAAKPKQRRPSINLTAICISLFLPWLLFCLMYWVMSFSLHYTSKVVCYLLVFVGFAVVAGVAKLAADAVMRHPDNNTDPRWLVFLSAACLIAWVSGVLAGDLNFFYNMEPYYDVNQLNVYPSVDPSKFDGQQVMDAGRLTFVKGSRLDLSKSMAFKNLETYCVAPIVRNTTGAASTFDFWAVGLNCCSGHSGDFSCGEYSNPHALSGLRVMRDDQREFYRLAVRQAEAAYNIKAKHPLFLYWMQDPVAEIAAYVDEGYRYYAFGVFSFFAASLFFTVVAIVLFAKYN